MAELCSRLERNLRIVSSRLTVARTNAKRSRKIKRRSDGRNELSLAG
jgi:hypothetical protein